MGLDLVVAPKEIKILKTGTLESYNYDSEVGDNEQRRIAEILRDVTVGIELADITIEMQVLPQKNFIKRAVCYAVSFTLITLMPLLAKCQIAKNAIGTVT